MYESGYRSLVKYSVFLLLIPAACYLINCAVGYVTGATLYEGDRTEIRKCRACSTHQKPEECRVCGRKGEVEVVIPGPKRPTRFWGVVVDRKVVPEGFENEWCPRSIAVLSVQAAFLPPELRELRGGVARATVLFLSPAGEAVEARTDAQGRFTTRLAPGEYRVKVSAGGFATLESKLSVAPLTAPIWNERVDASVSPELLSAEDAVGSPEALRADDERRSNLGLALVVALGRPEEREGYLKQLPVPR